jgi:hypothetical protein
MIKFNIEDGKFIFSSLDDFAEKKTLKANEVAKYLSRMLQERHWKLLVQNPMKGHTFHTLKKSPCSNFFVGNVQSPTSDYLVRFALRARTNCLPSEANLARWYNSSYSSTCSRCNTGKLGTLAHRLNFCVPMLGRMTERHDNICELLCRAITQRRGVRAISRNVPVQLFARNKALPDRSKKLRPDIWFEDGDRLILVEVTVPYGNVREEDLDYSDDESSSSSSNSNSNSGSEAENLESSKDESQGNKEKHRGKKKSVLTTLDLRRKEKLEKYSQLIEDCKSTWNCKVNYFIIVISSLGAVPPDITRDLAKLLVISRKRKNSTSRNESDFFGCGCGFFTLS